MLSDFMCTFFKENGIDRTLVMHAYTCEYAILTLAFNLLGPVNWTASIATVQRCSISPTRSSAYAGISGHWPTLKFSKQSRLVER